MKRRKNHVQDKLRRSYIVTNAHKWSRLDVKMRKLAKMAKQHSPSFKLCTKICSETGDLGQTLSLQILL